MMFAQGDAPLEPGAALGALAITGVLSILCLAAWRSQSRFVRLLRDVPTVPVRGVFVGLTETAGTVERADPLEAGLTGTPCVQHAWSVAEHWRRTETYRDSKGKTRQRTVHGRDVVASGGGSCDFWLVDPTGRVVVRATGASWTNVSTLSRSVGRDDPLYSSKAPDRTVRGSTGVRTFSESAVPVGSQVWIMGNARIGAQGDALEIGSGGEEGVFMVSMKGESSHRGCASVGGVLALLAGFPLAATGAALAVASVITGRWGLSHDAVMGIGAGVGVAIYAMVATVIWALMVRNGAVRVRQRWERAASLVDVELRRRADLVPNLVAVTQGLAVHERTVQQAVAELRRGAASDGVFRVLAERYPVLVADAAFLRLQRELTETESRIAQSRTFEIESRVRLVERLSTFPEGAMARVMGVAKPPPALDEPARPPSLPARRSPG